VATCSLRQPADAAGAEAAAGAVVDADAVEQE